MLQQNQLALLIFSATHSVYSGGTILYKPEQSSNEKQEILLFTYLSFPKLFRPAIEFQAKHRPTDGSLSSLTRQAVKSNEAAVFTPPRKSSESKQLSK